MFTIRDIKLGGQDSADAQIIDVYAKIENAYGVYRTEDRVLVQFADDPRLGADQRKLLCPLGPLRGEINGLIDGWRKAGRRGEEGGLRGRFRIMPSHDMAAKAALFDRRVADALSMALQGSATEAQAILTAVKADIVEERTSVARTEYVLVSAGMLAVLLVILGGITRFVGPDQVVREAGNPNLLHFVGPNAVGFTAATGALGALFSIALAIRSRELLTDLQSLDNIIDAAMRMLIGAVSAVLLYCLIGAGYFTFGFGGNTAIQLEAWQPGLAVVAFVAGFSERLVGNVLGGATLGDAKAASNPVVGGAAVQATGAHASAVSEVNPLGRVAPGSSQPPVPAAGGGVAAPANDDEEASEGGHQTGDMAEEDLTSDVELPEAVGGVEK